METDNTDLKPTPKESLYAQAIVSGKTRREAREFAGITKAQEQQYIESEAVSHKIRQLTKVAEERAIVTRSEILIDLLTIKDRAMGEGREATAIKALELLGKSMGLWTDRQEVKQDVGATIVTFSSVQGNQSGDDDGADVQADEEANNDGVEQQ